jgi:hypothetical protein
MTTVKRWTVEVFINEYDGHTYAQARLHTDVDTHLVGIGRARVHPSDRDVPEIGDELAASRALSDLGDALLAAAADDIEGMTGEPARLRA